MNKNNVVEYVIGKMNHNIQEDKILDEDLISEVEYALMEIDTARNNFNNVSDPQLIEVAIYEEEIAKKRFDYLLSVARRRGISVSNEYIINKFLELAE